MQYSSVEAPAGHAGATMAGFAGGVPYPCPVPRGAAGTHEEPRRHFRSGPGQTLPRSAIIRIPGLPNKGSAWPSVAWALYGSLRIRVLLAECKP